MLHKWSTGRCWTEGRGLLKSDTDKNFSSLQQAFRFFSTSRHPMRFKCVGFRFVLSLCIEVQLHSLSFQTWKFKMRFPVKRRKCSAFLTGVCRCEHPPWKKKHRTNSVSGVYETLTTGHSGEIDGAGKFTVLGWTTSLFNVVMVITVNHIMFRCGDGKSW